MPSNAVSIDGDAYEVITCRGVNQSQLSCPSGEARRFKGALVCKLEGKWAEQVPAELCLRLPNGCVPYELPPRDTKSKQFPPEFAAELGKLLPHVDQCEETSAAFSRDGSTPITGKEAFAFNRELSKVIPNDSRRYFQHGMARCCRPGNDNICVTLFLYEGLKLTPAELVGAIEQAMNATIVKDAAVEVDIIWQSMMGPRCDAKDPDCGPQLFGGGCLSEVHYDWGGPRKPISYFPQERGNECLHDGDCFGNEKSCLGCASRRVGPMDALMSCTEPAGFWHMGAMCGCYNGWCTYFRQ